ncbi:hypothetical protein [Nitratidesulfovibrio sp. 1201_IL3209]|uniref:hypothetical protein n=1 Tax=Nitratidesulfovibrio sp. 1201_IL3209 TaxID=3084053 RepID=UPI002FD92117
MQSNDTPKNGAERIAAERLRQVVEEGWTPAHDAEHHSPEALELAAACYAMPPDARGSKVVPHHYDVTRTDVVLPDVLPFEVVEVPALWPFEGRWWKPSTRKRDLEKAGALCAAAMDLRVLLGGGKATPQGMEWREFHEDCPRCGSRVEVLVPSTRMPNWWTEGDMVRCADGCGVEMAVSCDHEGAWLEHGE